MPYVPTITTMIRLDHTHVLAAFRRYGSETAWWRKRAIVTCVCRALEIHAQLEEEIFYPALARIAPTDVNAGLNPTLNDGVSESSC